MNTDKKASHRRELPPAITIRRDGTISIHKEAIVKFGLQEMKFATLEYDPGESTLSISPSAENPSALPILFERGQTTVIKSQEFLGQSGIEYQDRSRVYDAQWDEGNKVILVSIN